MKEQTLNRQKWQAFLDAYGLEAQMNRTTLEPVEDFARRMGWEEVPQSASRLRLIDLINPWNRAIEAAGAAVEKMGVTMIETTAGFARLHRALDK